MSTNIKEAIGRLENARQRIPLNLSGMMQSAKFAARMRFIAGSILDDSPMLTDDEKMAIPELLDTFMHATGEGGMKFTIQMIPVEKLIDFVDDGTDFLKMDVQDALLQWVIEYKEKKGRDYYADGTPRSDAEIARRVAFAIQYDDTPWLNSTNPEGLRQMIGLTKLPSDKVSVLLREVLAAWTAYMRVTLPKLAAEEIRKSFA